MGLETNTTAGLSKEIEKTQSELAALKKQKREIMSQKQEKRKGLTLLQAQLEDVSATDQARLDRIIARLKEQEAEIAKCRGNVIGYSKNNASIRNALSGFCEEIKKGYYRDGKTIPYGELADTAALVEKAVDQLLHLEVKIPDFNPLKATLKEIEAKALTLDHSKNIARRRLGRVLLGVGVVLAATAIVLCLMLFALPAALALAIVLSAGFSGLVGSLSLIFSKNIFTKDNQHAPLPKTVLMFRDTVKDVISGDKHHKPSLGKSMIRAMR